MKHEPLQLIQPQFETPLPALQPAVSGCVGGILPQSPAVAGLVWSWPPHGVMFLWLETCIETKPVSILQGLPFGVVPN